MKNYITFLLSFFTLGCSVKEKLPVEIKQWSIYEFSILSEASFANAYTDVDVWALFVNDKGDSLLRPGFWDGGKTWKIRFAPPDSGGIWTYETFSTVPDEGLSGRRGSFKSVPCKKENKLLRHGFLKMSEGKRNIVHDDGKPFLVVGDTPWSLPYRATPSQVEEYAKDRMLKGFNSALLICMQPDRDAEGPESRNTVLGFDRAFADSEDGHLNVLKPDYFQTLDTLTDILIRHELVPVYAPLVHGYGWKGRTALGSVVDPEEYSRFCKYLLARYGSSPSIWLISVDNNGSTPGVKPAGEMFEKWDCYKQPVGLHYNIWDNYLAKWAKPGDPCCYHFNRTYQEELWLDFQWAQTGHDGKHIYHKVEEMYENEPVKGNMNGEPTYEAMGGGKYGLGWWQGEDAWNQLMHGGTMGVIYGAVSLWQWKITPYEPEWEEWTDAPFSWRDALHLEGAKYVGYISEVFDGYDFADMQKHPELITGSKLLLAKEGVFYVTFLETGGEITIKNVPENMPFRWFNPITGEFAYEGRTTPDGKYKAPNHKSWVLVIGERKF